jgi:hypothetical protein
MLLGGSAQGPERSGLAIKRLFDQLPSASQMPIELCQRSRVSALGQEQIAERDSRDLRLGGFGKASDQRLVTCRRFSQLAAASLAVGATE